MARDKSRQLAGCDEDGALVEAARWEAGRDEQDGGDVDVAASDRLCCSLVERARWCCRLLLHPARDAMLQPLLACNDDARLARIAKEKKKKGKKRKKKNEEPRGTEGVNTFSVTFRLFFFSVSSGSRLRHFNCISLIEPLHL